jgi:hypothetical protein
MAERRKNSRVSPLRRRLSGERFAHLREIPADRIGRPYPPAEADCLLQRAESDLVARQELVRNLLRGEGERPEPAPPPRFTERDFKRIRKFAATALTHLSDEIELGINIYELITASHEKQRRHGRPADPTTMRTALAVEFLKCCREKNPERNVAREWSAMGRTITQESIRRDYFKQRHKFEFGGQLRGELRRLLLWRLNDMMSFKSRGLRPPRSAQARHPRPVRRAKKPQQI